MVAGGDGQPDRVRVERVGDVDPPGQADRLGDGLGVGERLQGFGAAPHGGAAQYLDLDRLVRVPDGQLHQEPVQLRLGEPVGAVHLDRVLRGHHEERPGYRMPDPVDGDEPFLHDLQ